MSQPVTKTRQSDGTHQTAEDRKEMQAQDKNPLLNPTTDKRQPRTFAEKEQMERESKTLPVDGQLERHQEILRAKGVVRPEETNYKGSARSIKSDNSYEPEIVKTYNAPFRPSPAPRKHVLIDGEEINVAPVDEHKLHKAIKDTDGKQLGGLINTYTSMMKTASNSNGAGTGFKNYKYADAAGEVCGRVVEACARKGMKVQANEIMNFVKAQVNQGIYDGETIAEILIDRPDLVAAQQITPSVAKPEPWVTETLGYAESAADNTKKTFDLLAVMSREQEEVKNLVTERNALKNILAIVLSNHSITLDSSSFKFETGQIDRLLRASPHQISTIATYVARQVPEKRAAALVKMVFDLCKKK